jgi:hypothetical protein
VIVVVLGLYENQKPQLVGLGKTHHGMTTFTAFWIPAYAGMTKGFVLEALKMTKGLVLETLKINQYSHRRYHAMSYAVVV